MIKIPRGKIIKIAENGKDIFDNQITLTLDSELTVNLQSEFDSLISNSTSSKLLQVLGTVTRDTMGYGFSGSFKEMGYKMWTGSNPIELSLSTTLHMETSGKTDVLDPAKKLMRLPLPTDAEEGKGFGLIAPGPSILNSLFKDDKTIKTRTYSIRVGSVYLPSIVVSKAEPTFSSECDSNGYPTWCTVQLDISGTYTATTQQIDMFGFENYNKEDWTYE